MALSHASGATPTDEQLLEIVLQAIRTANLTRDQDAQLLVSEDAELLGGGSPLDSLGLVALLLDIEEDLLTLGYRVVLSDDRAMSQAQTPFRSVASLVRYMGELVRT